MCHVVGPFPNKIFKRFEEAGGSRYVYKNEFYHACFWNDLAYGRNNKNLKTRTKFSQIFRENAFKTANDHSLDKYKK